MVSLSLFRTLLSLNCEDVMLQLILRYVCTPQYVLPNVWDMLEIIYHRLI